MFAKITPNVKEWIQSIAQTQDSDCSDNNPTTEPVSVALTYSSFGYISIPNYNRSNVKCSGSERSIYDCPSSLTRQCGSHEAAGVICEYAAPSNTKVELVGGNNTKEGNVLLNGSPIW